MKDKNNSISIDIDNNGVANLSFNLLNEKVNKLDQNTISELEKAINIIDGNKAVRILLFTSQKENNFIAGADINEIKNLSNQNETIAKLNQANQLFNRIANLKIPTIAVINGSCLGGGLELALACKYRVAIISDKTILGLPEVNLGIIPGFGGTQRLPALVGLTQALQMILGGKPINCSLAYKIGLVDLITHQSFLNANLSKFVCEILENNNKFLQKQQQAIKNRYWQEFFFKKIIFYKAKKNILNATKGNYPAPFYALEVIKRTYKKPLNQGLLTEQEAFVELAHSSIAKNLIELFFIQEEVKKQCTSNFSIDNAALVGAGVMGGGIAWLFANKNIDLSLKDINYNAIATGYQQVLKILQRKNKNTEQQILKISPTLDYQGFNTANLVIEAVVENTAIKQKVLQEIEANTSQTTIIASNTSSLSISELSNALTNPGRFAGLHFFNPVNHMPLVEIIAGNKTTNDTIEKLLAITKQLGKTAVVVRDVAGFLVNRILLCYLNEAAYLLQENVSISAIDNIIEEFGMPMGPFLLADTVGLDIGVKVAQSLQQAYGSRMQVATILDSIRSTHPNMLGKKSGCGFYLYENNTKTKTNPQINTILQQLDLPNYHQQIDKNMVIARCIYTMINEAAKCLQENVIANHRYLDLAMIFGTGFPAFRGGLLCYADSVGIANIVDSLQKLNAIYGERFAVSELLLEMSKNNRKFYS